MYACQLSACHLCLSALACTYTQEDVHHDLCDGYRGAGVEAPWNLATCCGSSRGTSLRAKLCRTWSVKPCFLWQTPMRIKILLRSGKKRKVYAFSNDNGSLSRRQPGAIAQVNALHCEGRNRAKLTVFLNRPWQLSHMDMASVICMLQVNKTCKFYV
jgi:hypothetical protein